MSGQHATLPRISLVTPSFNQGRYIEETILSVLAQGYPNLEYIVIDGGSTDQTTDILRKYAGSLAYWVSEPDKGQTDAINKGFARCTGEIFNWLNSDDYLEPGALFALAGRFMAGADVVAGGVRCFEEGGGTSWVERMSFLDSALDNAVHVYLNQPGTYFRKALLDDIFPLPVQLRYTMDQFMWINFCLKHPHFKAAHAEGVVCHFRRHQDSKTVSSADDNLYRTLSRSFFGEYNHLWASLFHGLGNVEAVRAVQAFSAAGTPYVPMPPLSATGASEKKLFVKYLFSLLWEDARTSDFTRIVRYLPLIDATCLTAAEKRRKKSLVLKLLCWPALIARRRINSYARRRPSRKTRISASVPDAS